MDAEARRAIAIMLQRHRYGAVWRHATPTRARDKPPDAATAKDGPASAGRLGRIPGGQRRGGGIRIC